MLVSEGHKFNISDKRFFNNEKFTTSKLCLKTLLTVKPVLTRSVLKYKNENK
jgi:hypothetical protein